VAFLPGLALSPRGRARLADAFLMLRKRPGSLPARRAVLPLHVILRQFPIVVSIRAKGQSPSGFLRGAAILKDDL
jgi:hypothetical protein